MLKTKALIAAAAVIGASYATAAAAGDAAAGEAAFRQCSSCHQITTPGGETLNGRGRTGPNLYGVVGRAAGSLDGFRYRDSIVEAGQGGLVWNEENLTAYLQDPTATLREATGDSRARSGMSYRVRSATDAENIAAYLASIE
jgi:cytochrome c